MGRATPSPPTRKHARSMGSVTLPVGVNVEKKATKSTKQSITAPSRSLPSQVKPVKDDLEVLVANLTVDCVKNLKTTQCIALMKHLGIQRGTHQSDRRVKVYRKKLTNFVSSTDNNFAPQLKIDVDELIKQGHAFSGDVNFDFPKHFATSFVTNLQQSLDAASHIAEPIVVPGNQTHYRIDSNHPSQSSVVILLNQVLATFLLKMNAHIDQFCVTDRPPLMGHNLKAKSRGRKPKSQLQLDPHIDSFNYKEIFLCIPLSNAPSTLIYSGEGLVSDDAQLEVIPSGYGKKSSQCVSLMEKKFTPLFKCSNAQGVNELSNRLTRQVSVGQCHCFCGSVVHSAPAIPDDHHRKLFWVNIRHNEQKGASDGQVCFLREFLEDNFYLDDNTKKFWKAI